jgi:Nif-specific regulatory protein
MNFSLPNSQLTELLQSQASLDRLIPTLLDIVLEATHAQRAFLILYENGNSVIKAARTSDRTDLDQNEFRGSSSIVDKVFQTQKAIYVPALPMNQVFAGAKSVRAGNLQSAICIPLWKSQSKELLGVLYVDSTAPAEGRLKEEDLQLLEGLANHVAISIENAKMFQQLQEKNQMQQLLIEDSQRELGKRYGVGNIIGKSAGMKRVFQILEKVVQTEATVLIQGESGTGKELVAKYLHFNGPRSQKPMVSINCAAFNDTLLESELFGHRKGAFTGADQNKPGLFQIAEGGTLFLDEVADMSDEMQKKLLRVLQDGEVRPVGAKDTYHADVRIVAAANKSLREAAQQGKFREDLFFRLNVIQIQIPPLRERLEDLPLLIDFYTKRISEELKRPLGPLPPAVMRKFADYDWPGNVRELENELRRVFILGSDYRFERFEAQAAGQHTTLNLETLEKDAILRALQTSGGNKTKAAELLGLPLRTFYERLKKYGM